MPTDMEKEIDAEIARVKALLEQDDSPKEFRYLNQRATGPIQAADLDTFPKPVSIVGVILTGTELTAYCPVTHQPDFYIIEIEYQPRELCLETKSLKLYLQSFREQAKFAEALCSEICEALYLKLNPVDLEVRLKQQVRGGIELQARAHRSQMMDSFYKLQTILDGRKDNA